MEIKLISQNAIDAMQQCGVPIKQAEAGLKRLGAKESKITNKARTMIAAFICGAPIPPEGARETIISICRARGFKL